PTLSISVGRRPDLSWSPPSGAPERTAFEQRVRSGPPARAGRGTAAGRALAWKLPVSHACNHSRSRLARRSSAPVRGTPALPAVASASRDAHEPDAHDAVECFRKYLLDPSRR